VSERTLVSSEDALILAIDEQLSSTSLGILRFLELEAERRQWRCSYRQRRQMYAHWVSGPHAFDVRALPNVVRITGSAAFVDVLLGIEQRVQRERRANGASNPSQTNPIRGLR
jgi:hypothetical protein